MPSDNTTSAGRTGADILELLRRDHHRVDQLLDPRREVAAGRGQSRSRASSRSVRATGLTKCFSKPTSRLRARSPSWP